MHEVRNWLYIGIDITTIFKFQMFVKSDSYYTGIMILFCFEVLTTAAMKSPVFWDIRSYSPMKVNRRLEGIWPVNFQGLRMNCN
jgi:type IV secretory pathway VirB3-like protein